MVEFQLSQGVWNKFSSQMNETAETNKLLKRAVKSTYKNEEVYQNNILQKHQITWKHLRKLRRQSKLLKTLPEITKTLIGPLQERIALKTVRRTWHLRWVQKVSYRSVIPTKVWA